MRNIHKFNLLFKSLAILLLSGCRSSDTKLFILFHNVEGLVLNSKVIHNGLDIGTVSELKIWEDQILVTTCIEKEVKIPKGSIFKIETTNLFSSKIINVYFDGSTNEFCMNSDTARGGQGKGFFSKANIDKLVSKIQPIADTLANAIRDIGTHNSIGQDD